HRPALRGWCGVRRACGANGWSVRLGSHSPHDGCQTSRPRHGRRSDRQRHYRRARRSPASRAGQTLLKFISSGRHPDDLAAVRSGRRENAVRPAATSHRLGDMIAKEQVLRQLAEVKGPDLEGDLVSLGLVSEIAIADGKVAFALTVDPERAEELEPMREAAERAVKRLEGVEQVMVALTAERPAGQTAGAGSPRPRRQPPPGDLAPPPPMAGRAGAGGQRMAGVPGVRNIIAVASGKGGVGKSTTAVNLALGLQSVGCRTGLLDADIYGPSIPRLLAITGRPEPVQGRVLRPMEGYGLKVMSMG